MRKLGKAGVIGAGALAVLAVGGGVMAFAGWSVQGPGATATLTAATMPVVPVPDARVVLRSVTISWDAVVVAPSVAVTGYTVTRVTAGQSRVICDDVAGRGPRRCVDLLPAAGTHTYRVKALFHNWSGQDSSGVVVTIPPIGRGPAAVAPEPAVAPLAVASASAEVRVSASPSPVQVSEVPVSASPSVGPVPSGSPSAS
jgi:hypothetical protein